MTRHLGVANWSVIVIYLLLIVSIGVVTKFKQKATKEHYLKGDGKVPPIVLGISIWATTLSAITFVAFTATVYRLDWRYWIGILTVFAFMPFVIKIIVPFFRKVKATTAYEYLEHRFSKLLRVLSSAIFVLFHIGRIAIVIYIPTMALYAVTGINPYVLALIIGALTIIYTVFGGLKGVIWTDFVQGCVFLIGIIVSIAFAIHATVGNFGSIMTEANQAGKIFSKDSLVTKISIAGVPLIFMGQLFNNVYQYVGSQDVVQRYNGSKKVSEVNKALIINGVLAIIGTALLAIIGTLMWSFYSGPHAVQNLHNYHLTKNDIPQGKVSYPTFALDVLPKGVSGLVIASVIAASQSTISASLSAIVSCITVDILPLFKGKIKFKKEINFSRLVTVICGILGLLFGIVLIAAKQDKLFAYWLGILGLFGSPVSVVFLLGIFTVRVNKVGAFVGFISTFLVSFVCWVINMAIPGSIATLWFPIFSMPIGLLFGYLSSFVLKRFDSKYNIKPLTIWGIKQEYNREVN
ncbi:MAG: sodium:solute symporter [Mycoplasmatales bacterium]|nr:sodium:solute symporter [Mycoplasmatales bacterium]